MKNLKKFYAALVAVIAIVFCSGVLTACDPDDVDAFADGYRQGYYSETHNDAATEDIQNVEQAE